MNLPFVRANGRRQRHLSLQPDALCKAANLLRRIAIDWCHMNLDGAAAGREECKVCPLGDQRGEDLLPSLWGGGVQPLPSSAKVQR